MERQECEPDELRELSPRQAVGGGAGRGGCAGAVPRVRPRVLHSRDPRREFCRPSESRQDAGWHFLSSSREDDLPAIACPKKGPRERSPSTRKAAHRTGA